jgi:hypothetical protein
MKYAIYKIEGTKASEFRAAAIPLFTDATIKAELQGRMINLDRATMSFELDVRGACPDAILDLGKRFGTPANSYE